MTLIFLGMAILVYAVLKLSDAKRGNRLNTNYIKLDAYFGGLIGLILVLQSLLDYYLKSDRNYLLKAFIYTANFIILYLIAKFSDLIYTKGDNEVKIRRGWLFIAILLVIPSIIATILI